MSQIYSRLIRATYCIDVFLQLKKFGEHNFVFLS